jgi:hypothetical protein
MLLMMLFFSQITFAQLTYKELRVEYDSAWTFKNLQLIPIKFKPISEGGKGITSEERKSAPRIMSFAEAMARRKVKVQEMQYEMGADVNSIQVKNSSNQAILVQSGEVLSGGKQDRMFGETKIISPNTTDYINVFCVEKRRWDKKPKDFKHRGVASSELRKVMDNTSRQADVWKEIDRQFSASKKKSETFSYLELYKDTAVVPMDYIQFFTRKYHLADSNLAGFIFITAERILGTEVFSSTSLLDISFDNMLRSYVQTAVQTGSSPKVPVSRMTAFMDNVLLNEEVQKVYVPAHGKIHKNEGKIIHIVAYPD